MARLRADFFLTGNDTQAFIGRQRHAGYAVALDEFEPLARVGVRETGRVGLDLRICRSGRGGVNA
jgi:hypothetical protein